MKLKIPVLTVIALPLAGAPLVHAQAGFTGPVGGDYATASNWSGAAIPGNGNNLDSWIGYGGQSGRSTIYQTATS